MDIGTLNTHYIIILTFSILTPQKPLSTVALHPFTNHAFATKAIVA
jgi:hypothetical protein